LGSVSPRLLLAALVFVGPAILVAGCNSSSTSSTALPTPAPSSSGRGTAACTSGAAPQSATVTVQNGTVTTPTTGGCSLTLTFTAVTTTGSATVTTQLTAPPNNPVPSPVPSGFSGTGTPVFYVTIKPTSTIVIGASPTLVFTAATVTAGSNFFQAFGDTGPSSVGSQGYSNAGVVSGSTITFASGGGGGGGTTLTAGDTYVLSLVYF